MGCCEQCSDGPSCTCAGTHAGLRRAGGVVLPQRAADRAHPQSQQRTGRLAGRSHCGAHRVQHHLRLQHAARCLSYCLCSSEVDLLRACSAVQRIPSHTVNIAPNGALLEMPSAVLHAAIIVHVYTVAAARSICLESCCTSWKLLRGQRGSCRVMM